MDDSTERAGETEREREGRLLRLFESPERLLEAVVAAEVLGPPLALRQGTTSADRQTF